MSTEIARLLERINEDDWRRKTGFSEEVQETLEKVSRPRVSDEDVITALNDWLAKYQPCLFGRIAAKRRLIHYCLLREQELCGPDALIKEKIQDERRTWTRLGFEGKVSGFVIVLLSPGLATAVPSATVKDIGLRICSLYLLDEVETDHACLDRIYLEQPGNERSTWEWATGVNYFSAQGDKRWWQDHRIPAGMAFSVNSVGHMVKSGRLVRAVNDLEEIMGTATGDFRNPKVDSLEKALELAMRTIDLASIAPSGRATTLIPLPAETPDLPKCPIALPKQLIGRNYCEYLGYYHTDFTIPSEYFQPDVVRPKDSLSHQLDFTYLFDDALDNPDFDLMGAGRRIRDSELASQHTAIHSQDDYRAFKRLRGIETEVLVDDIPRLREALSS